MDKKDFPQNAEIGSIWYDDTSVADDGLIDVYILADEWEFWKRDLKPEWLR